MKINSEEMTTVTLRRSFEGLTTFKKIVAIGLNDFEIESYFTDMKKVLSKASAFNLRHLKAKADVLDYLISEVETPASATYEFDDSNVRFLIGSDFSFAKDGAQSAEKLAMAHKFKRIASFIYKKMDGEFVARKVEVTRLGDTYFQGVEDEQIRNYRYDSVAMLRISTFEGEIPNRSFQFYIALIDEGKKSTLTLLRS